VQEAESLCHYHSTPSVIQQLLAYYMRADISNKLVQEAEYPSSNYYNVSGKVVFKTDQ
jgi:hypothetical protein